MLLLVIASGCGLGASGFRQLSDARTHTPCITLNLTLTHTYSPCTPLPYALGHPHLPHARARIQQTSTKLRPKEFSRNVPRCKNNTHILWQPRIYIYINMCQLYSTYFLCFGGTPLYPFAPFSIHGRAYNTPQPQAATS